MLQHNASSRKRKTSYQLFQTSSLDGIGRIGNDQLKGFIIPTLRCGQRVLAGNVKLIKTNIMQEHIDTAEVVCRDIDFLSIKAVSDGISAQNLLRFQKQRARALSCQANNTKYFYKSMISSLSKKSSTPMYKIPSLSCLGIMCFLTMTIFLNESSIFLSDAVSCSLFSILSTFKADCI